ncbi:staygreen family protein [Turicibacter sanguinis]|uniref:staygreen family protein n=1 Tax=Turicibacter sanguinis TaxID=154288 RepID=UPI0023311624|nr:staygreen family protein [Turicibacter sanguinis]MDB8540986.1 staygreen family protein [Turicibacter sanguinis]
MNEATSDYIWINDELNNFNQIIPRRYTLVHDPNISDLFLCINHEFMYQHLISSEFKLLGEWTTYDEKNICIIFISMLISFIQLKI